MIENLLSGKNTVPPSGNVIFQLSTFRSNADIVDRGPLNIPVTRGGNVSVGEDSYGSYILFPGGSFSDIVNFGDSRLSCKEAEINMTVGDILDTGGAYGPCMLEGRPNGQNGNYLLFLVIASNGAIGGHYREFAVNANQNALYPGAKVSQSGINKFRVKCLKNKTEVYFNEVLVGTYAVGLNDFNGSFLSIGRHAFSSVTGTTPFKGKVYYMDVRKIS